MTKNNKFAFLLLLMLFFYIGTSTAEIQRNIVPVKLKMFKIKNDKHAEMISQTLEDLYCPADKIESLTESIIFVAYTTDIKEELLIALIKTESNFNVKAVGPNTKSGNYKGLMQTPNATFVYSDVDILHGARILQDKLKFANGDLLLALSYYKGGNNPSARAYAQETLQLYHKLLAKNKERIRKENSST